MGCDIHCHVEVKINGQWHHWSAPNVNRSYELFALDLAAERVVGLGSVCRRQGTQEAADIVFGVLRHAPGLRLHGFGFKTQGIDLARTALASSDSMAWSFAARRMPPLAGCTTHINCANCPLFAMEWRARLLDRPRIAVQPSMF